MKEEEQSKRLAVLRDFEIVLNSFYCLSHFEAKSSQATKLVDLIKFHVGHVQVSLLKIAGLPVLQNRK